MKKLFAALAVGIALCGAFFGCAATITPAQIAATLCTPVNTAIGTITTLVATNPADAKLATAAAALLKVEPTINAVCTSAAVITSDNVQTLITVGLPAIGTILGTLPLPAATLTTIEGDFVLAEQAIDLVDVVVLNIKAAQAVTAVMSPGTPLSAAVFK